MDTAKSNFTLIPEDAHEKARCRPTYSSFGEDGLTATANAYGHLLQITQYFGNKPSGFVCVDLPTTAEPCLVSRRAQDLQRQSIDSTKGIRLLFEKADPDSSGDDIWETNPPTLRSTSRPALFRAPTERPSEEIGVNIPESAKSKVSNPAPAVRFVHNRWPCFSTETQQFDISIQYYISDKTIYQTYTFRLKPEPQVSSEIPKVVINANLLLRDLDFVTQENAMNKYDPDNLDTNYSCGLSSDGYCVARIHTDGVLNKNGRGAIALFISPFINGRRQQPQQCSQTDPFEEPNNYFIVPDEQARSHLRVNKTLEITLAYKLQWVSSNYIESVFSPVSEADLKKSQGQVNEYPLKPVPIVGDRHLDFALNRNLEHILSVCSVPISEEPNGMTPAIALTCGDMSGHRVAGAASFYAFQFLLLAFQYFESKLEEECSPDSTNSDCKDYSCNMRTRILRVCWGHLKWIFNEASEDDNSSLHSWASGEAIGNWESGQSLSRKSLVDASFNITKAVNFCQKAATDKRKENIIDELRIVVIDWVESLHQNNQNNEYVFPHSTEDTPQIFQLADHAIIWRTLKSLEELNFESELCKIDSRRQKFRYSSTNLQRSIFKHFKTRSTQLDKQMIATSRSLSETSFLLQIDDTETLYAMNEGLFNDANPEQESVREPENISTETLVCKPVESPINESPNKLDEVSVDLWEANIDPWKNTIDKQFLHEDNDDANWNHPLQFALAMILSAKGKRINSRTAAKMHNYAKSALLKSSSPNGLFPGQLDENREPVLFDDDDLRDCYWHATFEIPYILWNCERENPWTSERSFTQDSSSSQPGRRSTTELPYGADYVKTIEPFIQSKDQASGITLSCEWLYPKPKFFGFQINLSPDAVNAFCESHKSNHNRKSSDTIRRAVAAADRSKEDKEDLGYIIDVSGIEYTKSVGQRTFYYNVFSPDEIRSFIGGSRDSSNAKKRFFHFYRANLDIALNCYLASSEEDEMSSFFDKHASYSKYFFEDTTTILNKWVTELHLSYYQVVSNDQEFQTIPSKETFEFPSSTESGSTKRVGRAVMSFRFDGDLFDHYWTCHFFDYNPQWMANPHPGVQRIDKTVISGTLETDPWHQRRILELLIFDIILQEMVQGTKGILKDIMTSVLGNPQPNGDGDMGRPLSEISDTDPSTLLKVLEALSKVDSNTFASKNELWNKFQRILQVIEDDLQENLDMIKLWNDRGEKRKTSRLEWTPRREQKYQGAISKLKLSNAHKVHELSRCRANVASFNTLLTRRLEVMRNDLETRSNVDIRLFTYVTVVFLPISFATSVFSMSGAPTRETVGSMASTAGVALAITVVALLNAKILDAELFRPLLQGVLPISKITLRPVLRSCRHAFNFLARLIYLILLSLLSSLSQKLIHFLYYHLFTPIKMLVENAMSEQQDLQASEKEGFFDHEIEDKKKQIGTKRQEEAKRLKEQEEREFTEKEREREEKLKRKREKYNRKLIKINKELEPNRIEDDSAREGAGTGGSSDGTTAVSNGEAEGAPPRDIIQKAKRWLKLEGSNVDKTNV